MNALRTLAACAAAGALTGSTFAHVFWIQPSTFRPAPGEAVKIGLRVGDMFPGEPVARNNSKIEMLSAFGPGEQRGVPVAGRDGSPTVGVLRPTEPGSWIVAYRSRPSAVSLEAPKFEAYLREKGLETIAAERARRGESDTPVNEIFSRAAKALLAVGAPASDAARSGFDRVVGLRLEIVPESDPGNLKPGEAVRARVLWESHPTEGLLVTARCVQHSELRAQARTDAQGRVALTLDEPGQWVVETVRMDAAPAGSGAEWESVWASLTFQTGEPVERQGAAK